MSCAALAGSRVRAAFYVSTDGKDDSPGTEALPFATLTRARDAVRAKIAEGLSADAFVFVHGGTYRVETPLTFGSADSGTDRFSVTYAAYPGEKPVISGGRAIAGWRVNEDGTWSAQIRNGDAGEWRFRELFVNGMRRPRARHPDAGFLRAAQVLDPRRSLRLPPADLPRVDSAADAELVLLHDWSVSRNRLASVDCETGVVTTRDDIGGPSDFWRINGFEEHPRFFLENHRAFSDAPGEWYLDREAGVVHYRPLPGETPEQLETIAPVASQLLVVRGGTAPAKYVRNLHFDGLTFEHCAFAFEAGRYAGGQACFHWSGRASADASEATWTAVPAALSFEFSENCRLTDVQLRNVGGSGVWFGVGCRRNTMTGCNINDIGANGVMIGDGKARTAEQAAVANRVERSTIQRCGTEFFGAVGIWIGLSAENVIARNLICELPYTGVSVGWRWDPEPTPCRENLIEGNHIHHIMQVLSDGGGVYTLGRQPGTVLRRNWIHHIPPNDGCSESNGMFLDQGSSEIVIEGNVIHDVARSPLRFNLAGRNRVHGNVLLLARDTPHIRCGATDPADILESDNTVAGADAPETAEIRQRLAEIQLRTGPDPERATGRQPATR